MKLRPAEPVPEQTNKKKPSDDEDEDDFFGLGGEDDAEDDEEDDDEDDEKAPEKDHNSVSSLDEGEEDDDDDDDDDILGLGALIDTFFEPTHNKIKIKHPAVSSTVAPFSISSSSILSQSASIIPTVKNKISLLSNLNVGNNSDESILVFEGDDKRSTDSTDEGIITTTDNAVMNNKFVERSTKTPFKKHIIKVKNTLHTIIIRKKKPNLQDVISENVNVISNNISKLYKPVSSLKTPVLNTSLKTKDDNTDIPEAAAFIFENSEGIEDDSEINLHKDGAHSEDDIDSDDDESDTEDDDDDDNDSDLDNDSTADVDDLQDSRLREDEKKYDMKIVRENQNADVQAEESEDLQSYIKEEFPNTAISSKEFDKNSDNKTETIKKQEKM